MITAYKGRALRETPDKTFYLAYDLLAKNNPEYHHPEYYSYNDVEGQNKLRTPQLNNITLKVKIVFFRFATLYLDFISYLVTLISYSKSKQRNHDMHRRLSQR